MKKYLLLTLAILVATPAFADADSGIYISGAGSLFSTSLRSNFSNNDIYDPTTALGAEKHARYITVDKSLSLRDMKNQWGYNIQTGYQFNKYFGLEFQYQNANQKSSNYDTYKSVLYTEPINPNKPTVTPKSYYIYEKNGTRNKRLNLQGYFLNSVISHKVKAAESATIEYFTLYGKVGVGLVNYKYSSDVKSSLDLSNGKAFGYNLGVGGEVGITEGNSVFIELMFTTVPINKKYDVVVNNAGVVDNYTIKVDDIQKMSFNIGYKYKF